MLISIADHNNVFFLKNPLKPQSNSPGLPGRGQAENRIGPFDTRSFSLDISYLLLSFPLSLIFFSHNVVCDKS